MKILLTNDDGFQSQSYQMLGLALQKDHDVLLMSPERDCSGISHAFTLRDPLFVNKVPQHLNPLGAAVIIQASHGCMRCRGVKKQNAIMTTSAMRGVFFDKQEPRNELMQLIENSS